MLSKPFVPKLPTSWRIKISKKFGIPCRKSSRKFKRPPKSLRRRASIQPSSWKPSKKLMRKLLHLLPLKRKNFWTRMQRLPSIPWDKNSKTKSWLNSKPNSKNSPKTKTPTNRKSKKKSTQVSKNHHHLRMKTMRTKEIGDQMMSWSEGSISWRERRRQWRKRRVTRTRKKALTR